ncbi:MAG: hypothetical protein IIT53_09970, partial [Fibrobacter sp.]|nr:hypothetical protein [Fibrobacter sp.]
MKSATPDKARERPEPTDDKCNRQMSQDSLQAGIAEPTKIALEKAQRIGGESRRKACFPISEPT